MDSRQFQGPATHAGSRYVLNPTLMGIVGMHVTQPASGDVTIQPQVVAP